MFWKLSGSACLIDWKILGVKRKSSLLNTVQGVVKKGLNISHSSKGNDAVKKGLILSCSGGVKKGTPLKKGGYSSPHF